MTLSTCCTHSSTNRTNRCVLWLKSSHLPVRPSSGKTVYKPKFCQIINVFVFYLLYHTWNVVNVIFNTPYSALFLSNYSVIIFIIIIIIIMSVLHKGRFFTVNTGTKAAVLLGMNRCGSFPLFSAQHTLFSIWTDLERFERCQGPPWRWGEWIWLSGPSGLHRNHHRVKYQFHQGYWPDQISGKPNHPSPRYLLYNYVIFKVFFYTNNPTWWSSVVWYYSYLFNDGHVLHLRPDTVAVRRRMNMVFDDYDDQRYLGTNVAQISWHLSYSWGKTPEKTSAGKWSDRGSNPGPLRDRRRCYPRSQLWY